MPKHRKQSKIKIYRITSYKKDKRSELDSDKFELEQQDKQDEQNKQDKQVQSENVIIVPTDSHSLDVWDEISLKEIQAGEHTNLFEEKVIIKILI